MKASRIEWLDLVRGIAAIVVVLFHFHDYLGIAWLSFGGLAVDVFFALSGIVLGLKYTQAIEHGMPFTAFAAARLRRLYPMVFIAASFVSAMNVLGVPPAFAESDRFGWLLYLVLPLPGHWPLGTSFPGDTPMWSLFAELVVNVIWFAILRAGRRWMTPATWLSVIALVVMVWRHKTLADGFQQGTPMLTFAIVRALAWFNLGFGIAHLRREPVLSVAWALAALVACLAVIGWTASNSWALQLLVVALGLLLLHALLHARAPSPRTAAVARRLGLLSYPLYLVHLPCGRLLRYVDGTLGHWGAVLVVIGGIAVMATIANEALVDRLQRWHRGRDARAAAASNAAA